MTTFNEMNVSTATPYDEAVQSDTQHPKPFASLLAQADKMSDPTPE